MANFIKDKQYQNKLYNYTAKYVGKLKQQKHVFEVTKGYGNYSVGDLVEFSTENASTQFDLNATTFPIKEFCIKITGTGSKREIANALSQLSFDIKSMTDEELEKGGNIETPILNCDYKNNFQEM